MISSPSATRMPTEEQAREIHGIVLGVVWGPKHIDWGGHERLRKAEALLLAIFDHRIKRKGCHSCHTEALNILRKSVGLPPVNGGDAIPAVSERRMAICRACPVFNASTSSCGTLILDALTPSVVDVDGVPVQPCGCFLPLKVKLRRAICPAKKW